MNVKTIMVCAAVTALIGSACQRKKTGTHPDPMNAVLKCMTAFTSLATVPPDKRSDRLFRACADLYAHPSCRKAWTGATSIAPDRRTTHVMEECRKAYCPEFKKKGFKICKLKSLTAQTIYWVKLWEPLDRAITKREFGQSAAKRALELKINLLTILQPLILRHIPVTLPRAATRPVTDRTTVIIYLNRQKGKTVVLVNGKRSASFSGEPDSGTLKSLSKTLPPPGRKVKILFRSDPEVPFSSIVTLMDHLKRQGHDRFGFSLNLPR